MTSNQTGGPGQSGKPLPAWWWAVSALAVGLALGLGALFVFDFIARPLALLALGVTIAAALNPVVAFLERWLSRGLAIFLVYLVLVLTLVGLGWIIVPALFAQAQEIASRAPDLLDRAQALYNRLDRLSSFSLTDALLPLFGRYSQALITLPTSLFASLFEVLLVLFLSLYVLLEAPAMHGFITSLFPQERGRRVSALIEDMAQAMGGYIRGSLLVAGLIGLASYLGLSVIGVDFALVLGLLSGILELVPYLGPLLSAIPIVLVALLESPGQAVIALIFVIALQQVENYLLTPNIMRSQTRLSPLLVLLAILVGGKLGGLLGIIISIPIAAALRVFVRQVIAPWVRRHTGAPPPQHTD